MKIKDKLKKAVERFDHAARDWGYQSDQGCNDEVMNRVYREYQLSKKHLEQLIKKVGN